MKIDHTPLEHSIGAVTFQLICVAVFGSWIFGAIAGAAFFIGREHTQAEYRWIEKFGKGLRTNMPWYGGLDPKVWTKLGDWLDWLCPLFAVSIVVFIKSF